MLGIVKESLNTRKFRLNGDESSVPTLRIQDIVTAWAKLSRANSIIEVVGLILLPL